MVVAGVCAPAAHARPAGPPARPSSRCGPPCRHRPATTASGSSTAPAGPTRPDPWVPAAAGSGAHGQPVVPGAAHPRPPTRAVVTTSRVGPLRTGQRDTAGCSAGAPDPWPRSARRSSVTAAAGRWCSTHPAWAAPATAAPSWSRNWSAADTSWSPSITPTTPARSSSPTGASKHRRCRPSPEVIEQAVAVRVADTRFVLDTLTALNAGTNPDAEHRPTSRPGYAARCDCPAWACSVTPWAARPPPRPCSRTSGSQAGVNLDGTLFGPVVNAGLDRPFMLVAAQGHGRDNDESWAKFWANLRAGDSTCN